MRFNAVRTSWGCAARQQPRLKKTIRQNGQIFKKHRAYLVLLEFQRDIVTEFVDAHKSVVECTDAILTQRKADESHDDQSNRLDQDQIPRL